VRGADLAQALRTSWSLMTLQEQTIIEIPAAQTVSLRTMPIWVPASLRQVKENRSLKLV
jgi:hypothetical protein